MSDETKVDSLTWSFEEFGPDYDIEADPHAHRSRADGSGMRRWEPTTGMMQEELGLSSGFGQPLGAALTVFVAFLVGGVVPVVPFILASGAAALWTSMAMTAAALMVAGAIRTRYTGENALRAGAELVAMAAVGVGVAFAIGRFLHVVGVG